MGANVVVGFAASRPLLALWAGVAIQVFLMVARSR